MARIPGGIPSARGFAAIVDPARTPERLATGFRFVEGPSWHAGELALYFSDIVGDTLFRWSADTGVRPVRQPSNMSNGTTWDHAGRLLLCEHATSRVSRLGPDGRYEVLASHYRGRQLNSPNDIVVRSDGAIYFTDPAAGRTAAFGVERPQELDFQGVYRLEPDSKELVLLADDFAKPNGLCFSVDESMLFVNDTDRQHIRAFDVTVDGRLRNGRLWAETGGAAPGVADGMKCDRAGNLYSCGSGGIHVFDAGGFRLGILVFPEVPANFTWGGPGLKDLFVTARTSVYRLPTKIAGHCPLVPGLLPAAAAAGEEDDRDERS